MTKPQRMNFSRLVEGKLKQTPRQNELVEYINALDSDIEMLCETVMHLQSEVFKLQKGK